jgi:hypothetical protein
MVKPAHMVSPLTILYPVYRHTTNSTKEKNILISQSETCKISILKYLLSQLPGWSKDQSLALMVRGINLLQYRN